MAATPDDKGGTPLFPTTPVSGSNPSFSPSPSGLAPSQSVYTPSLSGSPTPGTVQNSPRFFRPEIGGDPSPVPPLIYSNRVASADEVVLSANEYAKVLETFFSSAGSGEFSFALFGHWGRGKTFLMQQLVPRLEKHGYRTVFFSAWKYPNIPDVWVFLYETLAKAAMKVAWPRQIARSLRINIARHGVFSFICALSPLIFLAFSQSGLSEMLRHWTLKFIPYIGIAGLVWLIMFASAFFRTRNKLKDFLKINRHSAHLGLQAVVGADLVALLKGWIPTPLGLTTAARVCLIAALNLGSFALAWRIAENYNPGLSTSFWFLLTKFSLYALAVNFSFILFCFLFGDENATNRILLVVDDLDRCSFTQLLTVMESIKLLVEDPEISQRVQVVMLIEEDILRYAILQKYDAYIKTETEKVIKDEEGKTTEERRQSFKERVVTDTLEKLFTAHLRLMQLERHDVDQVVSKIVDPAPRTKAPSNLWNATVWPFLVRRYNCGILGARQVFAGRPNVPQTEPTFFAKEEIDSLKRILPTLVKENSPQRWGPRSIRNLIFRYQLARLILDTLRHHWSSKQLASALVYGAWKSKNKHLDVSEEVKNVIDQVS